MATPWWAKVSADYYKKPSGLAASLAPRARHYAAVVNDTHLADEPNIAAAYMNANIPFSVAQRTDREYQVVKAGAKDKLLTNAGIPNMASKQTTLIRNAERRKKEANNYWGIPSWEQLGGQLAGTAGDVVGGFTDTSKKAATTIFQGANAMVQPIMDPIAMFRANQGSGISTAGDAIAKAKPSWTGFGVADDLINAVMPAATPGIVGGSQFVGALPLNPSQQEDMRKNGLDPNTFGDRWAWYYDSMEPGKKPVADSDVAYFKQSFNPEHVDAMREILTSNVLNDGVRDALSPEANKFLDSVTSDAGDPADKDLFDRMAKSSTLHPGSVIANLMGVERGGEAEQVVSAIGDLALLWYADPLAAAGRGLNAYRASQRGVSAGSITSVENQLLALEKPGDLSSGAATAAGKNFRDMIDKASLMSNYQKAAEQASTKAEFETNTLAANRIQQQWRLRHPDQQNQMTAVAQILEGKLDAITVKSTQRMDDAMTKAGNGGKDEFHPFEYVYPSKPKQVQLTIRRDADGKALNEDLNMATWELTKRMGQWIAAEAIQSGRPFLNATHVLLPGEVAFNRQVRAMVAPMRDYLIGTNKRLSQALSETKGITQFDGTFDKVPDLFLGNAAGQWTKLNYNQKWTTGFERWAANLSKSASGKTMTFTRPESTELYTRFITPWMPKEIASMMARKWMTASPGERYGMWRQTIDSIEASAGFKTNNPMVREFLDQLRKGVSHEYDSAGRLMGPNEIYTANKADNMIKAGGNEIAAALYPWQLSESFRLPNFMPMRQMAQKTGVLSAISGMFNSRIAMVPTSFWKVGKVGNSANMMRQNMELWYMGGMEQGVKFLLDMGKMRRYVGGETAAARLGNNEIDRAANFIYRHADGYDIDKMHKAFQSRDTPAYFDMLRKISTEAGASPAVSRTLSQWNEGVWIGDMVNNGLTHKGALQLARPLDMLRKLRLRIPRGKPEEADWHHAMDQEFINSQLKSALGDLGGSADHAMMMLGQRTGDDLADMAERGIGGVAARVRNGWEWVGAGGDSGARNWFREFDSRQTDPFTQRVMQGVAMEALLNRAGERLPVLAGAKNPSAAALINYHQASQGLPHLYPPHVETAEDIAAYLIKHDELGAPLRNHSMRAFHNEDAFGSRVGGSVDQDMAYDRMAQAQVRDIAVHFGAKDFDGQKRPSIHEDYDDVLRRAALGDRVTLDDLSAIGEDIRPTSIAAPLYIPKLGKYDKASIANAANKWYSFTVARPLMRLGITPAFLANRNVAYRAMAPAADELMGRGMSATQVAGLFEHAASKYAKNATFRYTDDVAEHSYFSEMTDNFLMFQRAAEDFITRFMKVTNAQPAVLSRSFLLTEAAQHSGFVYTRTERDEDGNDESHLTFTFPASGIMAKAIQESAQALGWNDSDLVLKPLYSSMSSQVRFVNPSLSNPLGFSTSPMIGMPLRLVRAYFPETDTNITNVLAKIEGGGERFFAEQGVVQSLLPTPIARILPATPFMSDDVDGQLASAVRNALVYGLAAGQIPNDDATADQKEEAHDAVRGMAINQLIWRAVVGSFSPWSPTYNEPEGMPLPELNPYDQARGLQSLKDEWFDVLDKSTKKYGDSAGLGEAFTEWYRRHPDGASIANPVALTVGTSRAPGGANQPTFNSGEKLTEWMMSNKKWILDNATIAYYLLPEYGDKQFTSQGFRQQLRNELREHKGDTSSSAEPGGEFYTDARYAVATKEYYARLKQRGLDLAGGKRSKNKVYDEWEAWEKDWRTAHPATAAEMDNRQNPSWVRGTLAPALQRVVEDKTAPGGVDIKAATEVWNHYNDYVTKYNKTTSGNDGMYDRSHLNKLYRNQGDEMFLGTPAEDLWKAMDIYEDGH